MITPGFYPEYLRGKSFPPPICPASPQKYCYQYGIQVTALEKSPRHDEVIAHTVTFLKIVSQNAPDCISAQIHFKKFLASGPP